ncbi:MAG: DMT family transporter [Paracoccaceae bacterium]
MDTFGAVSLVGFALLLAFNQVGIKITNEGFQPVFFAGIRSVGSGILVALWILVRGRSLRIERRFWGLAIAIGLCFAAEFIFLFTALDLGSVARTSVIFYTMPVWLALIAHLTLPEERLSPLKALGLALAFCGAAWAILDRSGGGGDGSKAPSLIADICALGGAMGWAGVALLVRGTRLRELRPDLQHLSQLVVSAPILLIAAIFFGPFVREVEPIHIAGLAFQIVVIAGAGFLFWIWLLSIYPASSVASFSFLSPIFGIALGWLILDEHVGLQTAGAGALVAVGLILINRRPRHPG